MKKVVINVKASNKMRDAFVNAFPSASFYGSATLGSKSKSYLIPLDEYEKRKDDIKKYGSRAKYQPFI